MENANLELADTARSIDTYARAIEYNKDNDLEKSLREKYKAEIGKLRNKLNDQVDLLLNK